MKLSSSNTDVQAGILAVTNALEWGQCCACRSVSPALHAQGLSRGAGSSKTLGPGDSGVSSASFETAREDALSRMGSAATQGVQTTYHNSPACTAAGKGSTTRFR